MSDFTIGVDPEFFLTLNGKPVSAHGLIPGDKKETLFLSSEALAPS